MAVGACHHADRQRCLLFHQRLISVWLLFVVAWPRLLFTVHCIIKRAVSVNKGMNSEFKTGDSFRSCQVEHHFSASYSSGESLLTKINKTLDDIEEGLNCFDTAKTDALNASHTAEMAFNISKQAKEVSILRVLSFLY